MPRLHDQVEVLTTDNRTRHQSRDLLLLDHFPVDELLDIGVVYVYNHHLGSPSGRPTRLDSPRCPVPYLQERDQPARLPAARQLLVLAPQCREVRPCARAVLEDASLPRPQVHDPTLVHEVIINTLDEARVGLRPLVSARRLL